MCVFGWVLRYLAPIFRVHDGDEEEAEVCLFFPFSFSHREIIPTTRNRFSILGISYIFLESRRCFVDPLNPLKASPEIRNMRSLWLRSEVHCICTVWVLSGDSIPGHVWYGLRTYLIHVNRQLTWLNTSTENLFAKSRLH